MVTIKSYGSRECIWCGREKEGVELTTDDKSFVGWLCFADLKRMLRLKSVGARSDDKKSEPLPRSS